MSYIDPKTKLFGHLPQLALLQAGGVPAPISVEIDLSNRCSLGCSWCHFAFTHTRGPLAGKRLKPLNAIPGGDLMDTELALSIIDQLAEAGVQSITWTGGGEPTLHKDFDQIISYAAGKVEQGIYTHGGHISPERAQLIKEHFTFVYVSLDAIDAETYKRDKGVDRFEAACEGIRRLAAADGKATVGLGYLVTRDNWETVRRANALSRRLGADYIQYRPTILYEQNEPNEPAEDTSWITRAIGELSRVEDNADVEVDLRRFRMYQHWRGHGYPTCYWSVLQTVITPSGKMWTCVNKREHPAALLGDLSEESFAEIWSRMEPAKVDGSCRLMCRGHLANQALDEIMTKQTHGAFI